MRNLRNAVRRIVQEELERKNRLIESGSPDTLRRKLLNPNLYSTITKSDLIVNGDLDLSNTNIKKLPAGLRVMKGNLYLRRCTSLTSLPNGLQVDGILTLAGCTSLKSLPIGLYVGESLDLTDCNSLKTLPIGLHVFDDLDLTDCTSLKSLPNGLRVDGGLDLKGCTSLKTLPNGLKIGVSLSLRRTTIAKMYSKDEIRAMIKAKGGYIEGDIYV